MSVQTNPSYQQALQELITQLEGMLPAEQLKVFNDEAERLGHEHTKPLKLKKGDTAPLFSLPNAKNAQVNLTDLLKSGPVVLTFYRGAWCPYCNLQLKQYQSILDQIHGMGAQLVAISPQTPDHSLDMQQKNELSFEVLSDAGNQTAKQYTTVFEYGAASLKAMKDLGYDFYSFYSDQSGKLPVPATFVINQDRIITFAASEGGDYRQRVEAAEILKALND